MIIDKTKFVLICSMEVEVFNFRIFEDENLIAREKHYFCSRMYTQEEAKQIRKKFWTLFGERCEIVPELKFKKKKWLLYDTGIRGIDIKFEVDRKTASVILEVNSKSEKRRLMIYEALEKYKVILENGFDDGLTWDFCFVRESGAEVGRIYTTEGG